MSFAASECLPRTFHIAEIHNWFSNNSIRQQKYCNLYEAINDDSTPLKIPAQATWLSIQIAVERIANQRLELKCHFQGTRQNDICCTSLILYAMYNGEKILAFLLSSNPILNRLFEKMQLLHERVLLFETIGKRLVLPTCKANSTTCHIEEFSEPLLKALFWLSI